MASCRGLVRAVSNRCRRAGRKEKGRILDEFVKVSRYLACLLIQGGLRCVSKTPVVTRDQFSESPLKSPMETES